MSNNPNVALRCPDCGAPLKDGESACWLCRRELPGGELSASSPLAKEGRGAGQFSLASIFLIVTLIAVCLGTLRLAPGLGVLLMVVAAPALIRTCIVGAKEKRSGHSLSIREKLLAFLASSAIIILIGVAGFIAFQIACWGSCAVVAGIQQKEGENALIVGIATGSLAGIGTMIWLVWTTWPRRKGPKKSS
jgi:hypothetical protein